MHSLKPKGQHVDLIPCYSQIDFHREAEERVFGFVRKFVNGLNGEDTALFLKFWIRKTIRSICRSQQREFGRTDVACSACLWNSSKCQPLLPL